MESFFSGNFAYIALRIKIKDIVAVGQEFGGRTIVSEKIAILTSQYNKAKEVWAKRKSEYRTYQNEKW